VGPEARFPDRLDLNYLVLAGSPGSFCGFLLDGQTVEQVDVHHDVNVGAAVAHIGDRQNTRYSAALGDESPLRRIAARACATSSGLRLSTRSPASARIASRVSISSRRPVSRSMSSAVNPTSDGSRWINSAARRAPSVGFLRFGTAGPIPTMLHLSKVESKHLGWRGLVGTRR